MRVVCFNKYLLRSSIAAPYKTSFVNGTLTALRQKGSKYGIKLELTLKLRLTPGKLNGQNIFFWTKS